jgi:hypothetical protein
LPTRPSATPTTAAPLAGLWVDRAENINEHYGISDKRENMGA